MGNGIKTVNKRSSAVLAPLEFDQFVREYWEQSPVHIERNETNPFESLLSIKSIESMLSTNELHFPNVQLSESGESIPVSEYTDDNNRIVSSRLVARYKKGSTIVLSLAQLIKPELMELCRCVQAEFGMRCQTNAYLSPAGKQGFNPHFDTHDVFILQVSGKKTFNFYAGGAELPTSADRFNNDIHTVGDKTEEIELCAGDTLYIPRGFVHDAVADEYEASLHITLGVYPVLMHELVSEIAQVSLANNSAMRKSVDHGVWRGLDKPDQLRGHLSELVQHFINDEIIEEALSRLRDDVSLGSTPSQSGTLSGLDAVDLENSKYVVNERFVLHAERHQNLVKLRCHGAVFEFEDSIADAVVWILDNAPMRLDSIPNLTPPQRLALVENLLESGVILAVLRF